MLWFFGLLSLLAFLCTMALWMRERTQGTAAPGPRAAQA
jgi:hypothetical protein